MTLEDSIALQTTANGSKMVRIPAVQLLELMRRAEAGDMDKLAADAWRKHCKALRERAKADKLARRILAADEGKARL